MHRQCLRSSLSHRAQSVGQSCLNNNLNRVHTANASTHSHPGPSRSSQHAVNPSALHTKPSQHEKRGPGGKLRTVIDRETPFEQSSRSSLQGESSNKRYWVSSLEARKGPIFEPTDADAGELTQETTLADDDENFLPAFTPGTFVEVRKCVNTPCVVLFHFPCHFFTKPTNLGTKKRSRELF